MEEWKGGRVEDGRMEEWKGGRWNVGGFGEVLMSYNLSLKLYGRK